jgi:tRNA (guanosine-2'-O-)-methyltransferase
VLENPGNLMNVGAIIRTVDALGVSKLYVVCDPKNKTQMPSWPESRKNQELAISSVSANKWVFVKVFTSTAECFEHLESKGFASVVTSPHDKEGTPSITLTNGSFTESKLAVWFGNESKGISDEASDTSNQMRQT